jgi:Biopolymer transport protein
MAKFIKKNKGEIPTLNTSSLPDIVFIILMFFMVCVNMRQSELKVKVVTPQASEIAKLERKDLTSYLYIGTPTSQYTAQYGTESRIQMNDAFRSIDDIRDFIAAERENLSEADRPFMTVNIKADQDTRMGIVTDVKQELRRCSALKIMYGARKGGIQK